MGSVASNSARAAENDSACLPLQPVLAALIKHGRAFLDEIAELSPTALSAPSGRPAGTIASLAAEWGLEAKPLIAAAKRAGVAHRCGRQRNVALRSDVLGLIRDLPLAAPSKARASSPPTGSAYEALVAAATTKRGRR